MHLENKVLILTPFYPPNLGGAETFVQGLVDEAKKWFNVTVLTFQPFNEKVNKYEETYSKRGCLKVYRIDWPWGHGKAWFGLSIKNLLSVVPTMTVAALYLTFRYKYRVIHAQGLLSALVGVLLKKIFGCRLYVTLLALYGFDRMDKGFNICARFVLNNCDIVFVEGENGEKDLEPLRIRGVRIRRFSHWTNQIQFRPPESRDPSRLRVLFIGRPLREKGRHIVEGAERIINNSKIEFKYVEKIAFKELPDLYRMADVVCVPSLYNEGYSRVVVEAASCGCAVITSDRGSLPEMVEGWGIVRHPDSYRWALEIKRLNSEREYLSAHQKAALEYAQKNFSIKNAEVFLNEY